ncbi:MAG: glucosidase, partial [Cytophagales bacterium]
RQWGTVREDYSEYGAAWEAFTHDESRSRVYRWGEDGLMGISDENQLMCLAFAFWNGNDAILKERLFGLTGNEGNHSEDVKEYYYYLASTPTHSYMKMLYKYPQKAFPYSDLIQENGKRNKLQPEYELADTNIFDKNEYFNIEVEYSKINSDDLFVTISIENKADKIADITILPTLWFRNTWNWGYDNYKPIIKSENNSTIEANHEKLGKYYLHSENDFPQLFTENETNATRLYGLSSNSAYVKDAFHEYIIHDRKNAINPSQTGTKAAFKIKLSIERNQIKVLKLRLSNYKIENPFSDYDFILNTRKSEHDDFYKSLFLEKNLTIGKQLMAGMYWGKQYYEFNVKKWLQGDPNQYNPPSARQKGRNSTWKHIDNHDIISMPDKWEYPWFAAWDSAFHCIAIAKSDIYFAKQQLLMFLSDRYMNDFGQIPAYEWAFGDVNPPVISLGIWETYLIDKKQNNLGDITFLKEAFDKLELNFQWWIHTQTKNNRMIFGGGFLGLDNVACIDRGKPLPERYWLEQVDGTVWMARFALDMVKIALELAQTDDSKIKKAFYFTKIFLTISQEINHLDTGLWSIKTEFYHDKITNFNQNTYFLDHKNIVGLLPLIATDVIEINNPNLEKYLVEVNSLIKNNETFKSYFKNIGNNKYYFSLVPEDKFFKLKSALFSKNEFMGDFGIRSLSYQYLENPYKIELFKEKIEMKYTARKSNTTNFGENSNWRGPVWLPTNYVILQSLIAHAQYFGNNLLEKRKEIIENINKLFIVNNQGYLPIYTDTNLKNKEDFNQIPLFYEFFDPETGKGIGASHQTGWTGLIASLME